jgi:hypothetical protein
MKKLLITAFALVLTIAPVKKSEAAVAGVMALSGAGAAGSVAIAGLASPLVGGVGLAIAGGGDDMSQAMGMAIGLYLGGIVGLVLLDEESGDIQFNQINNEQAAKLELDMKDVAIYNQEIEEANILVEEVTSYLSAESSVEESRELWNEMKDFVSPQTYKVMQKLVATK